MENSAKREGKGSMRNVYGQQAENHGFHFRFAGFREY